MGKLESELTRKQHVESRIAEIVNQKREKKLVKEELPDEPLKEMNDAERKKLEAAE